MMSADPKHAPGARRTPFVLLVLGLIVGGMCLLLALNTAAAEWVHARLMGFDPAKIPLTREAFGKFAYPVADFPPSSIRLWMGDAEKPAHEILPFEGRAFVPPRGWRGHCELDDPSLSPVAESNANPVLAPPTEA